MTAPGDRDVVQRALARLYDRVGSRVALVAVGVGFAAVLVTLGLIALAGALYLDVSTHDAWELLAIGGALVSASIVGGLAWSWSALQPVLAWAGERRTAANAPAAWSAAIRAPFTCTRRCLVATIPGFLVSTAVVTDRVGEAWAAIPIALSLSTVTASTAVLVLFLTELFYRPMLEDVAVHLPADFEPAQHSWPLRTKALAPLPVVTLVAALGAGAFANLSDDGPVRLTITLGVGLAIVAGASAIFVVMTRSMLDPVDDLIAATRRVRAGDLTAAIPVVTADEIGSLTANFNQMLVGLRERESLQQELQDSRARIVAASDAARRRVERDLHDGAQQSLVLLNLKLGLIRRAVDGDPKAAAMVDDARTELQRGLAELRDLAHGIYPAVLENEGLAGALADAVRRAGIPAQLESDGAGRYRPDLEAAVYFCCLEALQNAAKHAGADAHATIRLSEAEHALSFEVADDGRGYDASAAANGGVQNMADRIGALGGELRIESSPGRGTTVRGTVPLT